MEEVTFDVEFEEPEPIQSLLEPEATPSSEVLAPVAVRPEKRRKRDARRKAKDINAEFLQDMGYPTPLEFLVGIYSDENIPRSERMDAAKSAAPYVHAKLNNIDINANVNISHEDALDYLDDIGDQET